MSLREMLYLIIRAIIHYLRKYERKEKEGEGKEEKKEEEKIYTRDDFLNAVNELSDNVEWRARMLVDCLQYLRKKYEGIYTKWIDVSECTDQEINRNFGCGISYLFGKGIYAIMKDDFIKIVNELEQNMIKWREEESDCDNIATAFKGFVDYIVGKPVVIYTTGMVFRKARQFDRDVCLCKMDYLVGGHAWNRVCILEPVEFEIVGTTKKVVDEFTLIDYEPQNDKWFTVFANGYCYKSGGGLPIIYGDEYGERDKIV